MSCGGVVMGVIMGVLTGIETWGLPLSGSVAVPNIIRDQSNSIPSLKEYKKTVFSSYNKAHFYQSVVTVRV